MSTETNKLELPHGYVAEVKQYLTVKELRVVQKLTGSTSIEGKSAIDLEKANQQSDELAKIAIVRLAKDDNVAEDSNAIIAMIDDLPLDTYVELSDAVERLLEPVIKKAQRTSEAMPPAQVS